MDDQGIVHYDIKPENILWSQSEEKFVLIDFGLGREEHQCENHADHGTPRYLPPEAALGHTRSSASDTWAGGVVLLWGKGLISLKRDPWNLKNDAQSKFAKHWDWIKVVKKGRGKLPPQSMTRKMLNAEPSKRPRFKDPAKQVQLLPA